MVNVHLDSSVDGEGATDLITKLPESISLVSLINSTSKV